MLRTIIVDDEDLARSVVREHLAAHRDIQVVAECSNGFEAVKAVGELSPDILFLDVQMPKLDGFEVVELMDPKPAVVFVTAYDSYALKAFEVHAVDYLLKPFSGERFTEALEHARARIAAPIPAGLAALMEDHRVHEAPIQRILVKNGTSVVVIPSESIDYIEAEDDYVAVHSGGKRHLKQERLSELAQLLDPVRFIRIHRSFILNIDRLARLETYAKDSRVAILKDGTRLPVSRSGHDRLREIL